MSDDSAPRSGRRAMTDRKYTRNGNTFPISRPELSDSEVAGRVRMLTREQLNHEFICTMARDRIMCLTSEKDALAARVLELEAALGACIEDLMSVYRSEFDGVWADIDFEKIEAKYRAALEKGDG